MKTLDQVLEIPDMNIDRSVLEEYIAHEWLHPTPSQDGWHFEEIDVARLQLVRHLAEDIKVNDDGMDVILSLLDQLYGLRSHMQKLMHAIAQQPPETRAEIMIVIKELAVTEEK